MDEFVRIRTANGREVSISAAFAAHLGDAVEYVDSPATNGRGPVKETRAGGRRVKPKTTVKKAAAKKAAKAATPSEPGATTDDGAAVDQPQEA